MWLARCLVNSWRFFTSKNSKTLAEQDLESTTIIGNSHPRLAGNSRGLPAARVNSREPSVIRLG